MFPVGYLVNLPERLQNQRGAFYDYILALNGLFLRAESPLLKAVIRIAEVDIRGLEPLTEKSELVNGKIPSRLGHLALDFMRSLKEFEVCLAITWDGGYRLEVPCQEGRNSGVTFTPLSHVVVELHSHGTMGAFFSHTDDADEQGLRIYVVVGKLHEAMPEALLRVGVYGYFREMNWEDVFEL